MSTGPFVEVRCLKDTCRAILAYIPADGVSVWRGRCSQCHMWRFWSRASFEKEAAAQRRPSKPPRVATPIDHPIVPVTVVKRKRKQVKK